MSVLETGAAQRRGRLFERAEIVIAAALLLALVWSLTSYKINNWYWQRGDSAVMYQVTDSIARTGVPHSQIFATATAFIFDSGLATLPVDKFAHHDLAPPPSLNDDPLGGHAYFILYPIALVAKFIPARPLILALTVLCFVGVLAMAYFELRRRRVPVVTAILFGLLIVSHPTWASGMLYGQVYPDRFFVLAGLALMFLVARDRLNRPAIIALAVLCALVNERGALIAGLFMVLYAALYWKVPKTNRLFVLATGLALLMYSAFLLKVVLVNPIYANQAFSLTGVFALLRIPSFLQTTELMFLVCLPFLVLALFEWRAAVIATFLMLPNVAANIGGAEKIGWSTHYSSFYFPALVWAAVLGVAALSRHSVKVPWLKVVAGVLIALFVVTTNMLDPSAYAKPSLALANASNDFLMRTQNYMPPFEGTVGFARYEQGIDVARAIPDDAKVVVTTVEQGMPLLYDKTSATLLFFPLGLDKADYAVMSAYQAPGKPLVFYGAITFLGAPAQVELNQVIMARMKKDGYDFAHATVFAPMSLAVIKRTHS